MEMAPTHAVHDNQVMHGRKWNVEPTQRDLVEVHHATGSIAPRNSSSLCILMVSGKAQEVPHNIRDRACPRPHPGPLYHLSTQAWQPIIDLQQRPKITCGVIGAFWHILHLNMSWRCRWSVAGCEISVVWVYYIVSKPSFPSLYKHWKM